MELLASSDCRNTGLSGKLAYEEGKIIRERQDIRARKEREHLKNI